MENASRDHRTGGTEVILSEPVQKGVGIPHRDAQGACGNLLSLLRETSPGKKYIWQHPLAPPPHTAATGSAKMRSQKAGRLPAQTSIGAKEELRNAGEDVFGNLFRRFFFF